MKAHFDGQVIVPDEPVPFPVNAPLDVRLMEGNGVSPEVAAAVKRAKDPQAIAESMAALERIADRASRRRGTPIPTEMLRREHLYGDDER
jgi:hypothetical protein